MHRRHFLAASCAVVPAALPIASSAAPRCAQVLTAEVVNRTTNPAPGEGSPLTLRREPERRFDPASIAVLTPSGAKLGYLPPVRAEVLAALMDAGVPVGAQVNDDDPSLLMVGIFVTIGDNSRAPAEASI